MSDLSLTRAGNLFEHAADTEKQLNRAAAQFESFFIKQLFENANHDLPGPGGLFEDSSAMRMFEGMLQGALSEQAAGSMGIAQLIEESIALGVRSRG